MVRKLLVNIKWIKLKLIVGGFFLLFFLLLFLCVLKSNLSDYKIFYIFFFLVFPPLWNKNNVFCAFFFLLYFLLFHILLFWALQHTICHLVVIFNFFLHYFFCECISLRTFLYFFYFRVLFFLFWIFSCTHEKKKNNDVVM